MSVETTTAAAARPSAPHLVTELPGPRARALIAREEPIVNLDDADGVERLRADYQQRCATIGREVRVERPSGMVSGHARGIDGDGRLLVAVDGTVEAIAAGDVVYVRPAAAP